MIDNGNNSMGYVLIAILVVAIIDIIINKYKRTKRV